MNQPEPAEVPRFDVLVPPRPNPGPEPWDDRAGWPAWAALTLATAMALAWIAWRHRSGRVPSDSRAPLLEDAPADARLLALCDRLRADLAAKLGPSLRARTTQELAADPRVAELLGADLPRLAEILGEGDLLKFARRPSVDLADRIAGWSEWDASRTRR